MRKLAFLPFILCFATSLLEADEWWAWTQIDFVHEQPWTVSVLTVNRLDFDDGAYVQTLSPKLKFEALPWLDLGMNLTWNRIESAATGQRYDQFRPELEANPKFALSDHLRLEWRNRMEWRLNEGEAFTTHRTRHRLQLSWTLPRPFGPLTRLYASDEVFFDLHHRRTSENRLIPAGLTFKLHDHVDLDLFYMLFSQHRGGDWSTESVFGTFLKLRF